MDAPALLCSILLGTFMAVRSCHGSSSRVAKVVTSAEHNDRDASSRRALMMSTSTSKPAAVIHAAISTVFLAVDNIPQG